MKKALIVSCFHGWYRNRLYPIIKHLEDKDYKVLCALSDFNHIKKEYLDLSKEPNCTYIHVPSYKSNISLSRIISHFVFGKGIKDLLNKEKPDLVYLLVPPNVTSKYCANYKKDNPDKKLILDIIDLWPESFPFRLFSNTLFYQYWKKLRNDAIKVSDFIFIECNFYKKLLSEELKDTKSYSLSLFLDQSLENQKLVIDTIHTNVHEDKKIKLAYLGSMNNILDIETIVRVIKYFINKGFHCELYAIGDGEKRNQFENAIKNTGCSAHFYGVVFDEKSKISILAKCDFGLNIMKDISVGLTLKSIEYFSCGLPIINNIKADTWELVNNEKIGINISNDFDELDLDFSYSHEKVLKVFKDRFTKESFIRQLDNAFGENCV